MRWFAHCQAALLFAGLGLISSSSAMTTGPGNEKSTVETGLKEGETYSDSFHQFGLDWEKNNIRQAAALAGMPSLHSIASQGALALQGQRKLQAAGGVQQLVDVDGWRRLAGAV